MQKCNINTDGSINFCETMITELKNNETRTFQLVCRDYGKEAVLLIPIMTIINYCPFCGGDINV